MHACIDKHHHNITHPKNSPGSRHGGTSQLSLRRTWKEMFNTLRNSKRPWQWPIRIIAISALLATVYLIIFYHTEIPLPKQFQPVPKMPPIRKPKPQFSPHNLDGYIQRLKDVAEWQKPPELKVMGLVFFGRRRFVSVLQCYLQVHTKRFFEIVWLILLANQSICIAKSGGKRRGSGWHCLRRQNRSTRGPCIP